MDMTKRTNFKYRLNMSLTSHCNCRCPQCPRIHRGLPGLPLVDSIELQHWTYSQFVSAFPIEMFPDIKRFVLNGNYGDPILCPDIYEICEYIVNGERTVNCGTRITIHTNGAIRSSSWWHKLGELKIRATFAINGTTQEMHEKYRRGSNLAKVLTNMQAFTDGGGIASAKAILFKHNIEYIDEITKLASDHGAFKTMGALSNRFYNNNKSLSFIDKDGLEYLYSAEVD